MPQLSLIPEPGVHETHAEVGELRRRVVARGYQTPAEFRHGKRMIARLRKVRGNENISEWHDCAPVPCHHHEDGW